MNLHNISKRITAIGLSAVLMFSVSGCAKTQTVSATPNAEFDAFLEELFLEEVTDNTLNLQFT